MNVIGGVVAHSRILDMIGSSQDEGPRSRQDQSPRRFTLGGCRHRRKTLALRCQIAGSIRRRFRECSPTKHYIAFHGSHIGTTNETAICVAGRVASPGRGPARHPPILPNNKNKPSRRGRAPAAALIWSAINRCARRHRRQPGSGLHGEACRTGRRDHEPICRAPG